MENYQQENKLTKIKSLEKERKNKCKYKRIQNKDENNSSYLLGGRP